MDHQYEGWIQVAVYDTRLEETRGRPKEVIATRLRKQVVAAVDVAVELPAQAKVQR